MTASGCVSKCSAKLVSSLLIWWFSSAMMPTVARVAAANAAVTWAGAAGCSDRSGAWICRARATILRWRPSRLSADWSAGRLNRAACSGVGARSDTLKASPWARSSKASSAAG